MTSPLPPPLHTPGPSAAAAWRRVQRSLGWLVLALVLALGLAVLAWLLPDTGHDQGHGRVPGLLRSAAAIGVLALGVVAARGLALALRGLREQARRLELQVAGLERLAAVAEHTGNPVLIADAARRVVWANAAYTRVTGWEWHEVDGRLLDTQLAGPDADPHETGQLAQALDAGTAVRVLLRLRSRDGRDNWVDVDLQPLHDATGTPTGFVSLGTVITGRLPAPEGAADDDAVRAAAPAPAPVADDQALAADLRAAVERGQLQLVYLPMVDLERRQLVGVEALLRWRDAQRGDVPPAVFLPVAEAHGLIDAIGDQVLHQACAAFADWHQRYGAQAPERLVVNLSPLQLRQLGAVPEVLAVLDAHGVRPQQLQVDLTRAPADDDEAVHAALRQLKARGVHLALDDFGSGHSSMASLHRLPVDTVKIDRSFVAGAAEVEHHRVLITATVRVARTLGLTTVAEGVETDEQAQLMATLGCERAQGWLFGRPLPADAMAQLLATREPSDTAA